LRYSRLCHFFRKLFYSINKSKKQFLQFLLFLHVSIDNWTIKHLGCVVSLWAFVIRFYRTRLSSNNAASYVVRRRSPTLLMPFCLVGWGGVWWLRAPTLIFNANSPPPQVRIRVRTRIKIHCPTPSSQGPSPTEERKESRSRESYCSDMRQTQGGERVTFNDAV
jgi:hypothetical protein